MLADRYRTAPNRGRVLRSEVRVESPLPELERVAHHKLCRQRSADRRIPSLQHGLRGLAVTAMSRCKSIAQLVVNSGWNTPREGLIAGGMTAMIARQSA